MHVEKEACELHRVSHPRTKGVRVSPARRVTRRLTQARAEGARQLRPFPEGGRNRDAALGGSRETPGTGLRELPRQTRGAAGQDVAVVRLSPEKGHSGARVGGPRDPHFG